MTELSLAPNRPSGDTSFGFSTNFHPPCCNAAKSAASCAGINPGGTGGAGDGDGGAGGEGGGGEGGGGGDGEGGGDGGGAPPNLPTVQRPADVVHVDRSTHLEMP